LTIYSGEFSGKRRGRASPLRSRCSMVGKTKDLRRRADSPGLWGGMREYGHIGRGGGGNAASFMSPPD